MKNLLKVIDTKKETRNYLKTFVLYLPGVGQEQLCTRKELRQLLKKEFEVNLFANKEHKQEEKEKELK